MLSTERVHDQRILQVIKTRCERSQIIKNYKFETDARIYYSSKKQYIAENAWLRKT